MATERAWPDVAIPPGDILAEELEARGLTQSRLARRREPRRQTRQRAPLGRAEAIRKAALELDSRFLKRVAAARRELRAGKGVRLEDLPR